MVQTSYRHHFALVDIKKSATGIEEIVFCSGEFIFRCLADCLPTCRSTFKSSSDYASSCRKKFVRGAGIFFNLKRHKIIFILFLNRIFFLIILDFPAQYFRDKQKYHGVHEVGWYTQCDITFVDFVRERRSNVS